ncbi:MAG TPA: hypothetical protein VIS07_14105 [Candidatus Binatia bacterium]
MAAITKASAARRLRLRDCMIEPIGIGKQRAVVASKVRGRACANLGRSRDVVHRRNDPSTVIELGRARGKAVGRASGRGAN